MASTFLIKGSVRRGAVLPDSQIAFFGSEDLFETSELVARQPSKSQLAAFAADVADLKPGDFVVHATHGVGRFLGIREIAQGEQKGDYMLLEYAGESKLYVPLTRMDLVQKYRGAGEAKPPLDRLGGATWDKTKIRVKAKMRDMADELLKLYAQRKMAEGFAFSPDSNWQREFEDAFEFTATKDQLTAVAGDQARHGERRSRWTACCAATSASARPKSRCAPPSKRWATASRWRCWLPPPCSRFSTSRPSSGASSRSRCASRCSAASAPPKKSRQALEDLAAGKVDVAIGTHRLLSKDVEFHDLGLLIVDEEQRFGVRHKERLKQIRRRTWTCSP